MLRMARYGYAASVVALMFALSATGDGQAQSVQTGYTYDVHGRLTKVTRSATTTEYEYDKAQNRTRVVIAAANSAPVANDDGTDPGSPINVMAGSAVSFNPLSNDTDANIDPFFLVDVSGWNPSKGSVTFVANCLSNAATCVTYTAASSATGTDSFTYTISDGHGGTATGTITVTINATPPVPTAQNFAVTITPNSAGNVSNYSLPLSFTGGTPTSVSTSQPNAGSASASGTSIAYSSNGWSGQTSLQYTGTNSAGTGPAGTAQIYVRPVVGNVSGGTATPGQARTLNLSSYALTSGITSMSLPNGSNTQKGTASISGTTLTYTAGAGQTGTDTFAYTAASAGGTSAPANITFNISCAAPVVGSTSATVAYNSQSNVIPLNISGSGITSVNYVTGTSHGSVAPVGATMYYSPFQGYSGTDSFTYTATNACGTSNTGTATITVQPPPNRNPVIVVGTTHNVGQSTTISIQPQADDTDADNDPLTVTSVSNLRFAYGSINGSGAAPASIGSVTNYGTYVVYSAPFLSNTPPSGSSYMAVVFDYTVSDGRGGTATGAHVVNVYNYLTNSSPVAQNDLNNTMARYDSIFVPVLDNDSDPDNDTLSIISISSAETARAYYSISGNGIIVSSKGSRGLDSITYTISDGRGGTATATLRVSIEP
jgi:YD repeat-containing protein